MSTLNNLEVLGDLYAVTTNKGDLIINDGVKNVALPVGTNGYVLSADSVETTGVKWIPLTASSAVTATKKTLSTTVSTNSTSPITITDLTESPSTGSYVIISDLVFTVNRSGEITIGLYKNDILLADTQRTLSGLGSNVKSQITTLTKKTASGSDIFTLKFNSNSNNVTVTITQGILIYLQIANSLHFSYSNIFSTNATVPVSIADFEVTPPEGMYIAFVNFVASISKINRSFTFGFYKNGVLIDTSATVSPTPNSLLTYNWSASVMLNGTDIFAVKISVSNTDTFVNITNRDLVLLLT